MSSYTQPLGAFKELARLKLVAPSDDITVSNLPINKWLCILVHLMNSGSIEPRIRFNGDSANNYVSRRQVNGAADVGSGATSALVSRSGGTLFPYEIIAIILNHNIMEKMVHFTGIDTSTLGTGTSPNVSYTAGKWANNTDYINSISVINVSTGDFDVDSELIVLGIR